MPGVPGRSGRRGKLTAQHIAEGTYRADRHGERKAMQEQMSGAPLAKSESVRNLSINVSPTPTAGKEKFSSLTDPTQRPEEAFSNGFSFGEGLRPTDIGLPMGTGQPDSEQKQDLMQLSSFLPIFETVSNMEGTPRGFRTFTKYLRSL